MTTVKIKNYLDRCGVKHSQLGFKYLVSVFNIMCEEPDSKMTLSEVYEQVAEQYNSTPKSVAKAIDYSIRHHKVTNKEFIYRAIDNEFNTESERETGRMPLRHVFGGQYAKTY